RVPFGEPGNRFALVQLLGNFIGRQTVCVGILRAITGHAQGHRPELCCRQSKRFDNAAHEAPVVAAGGQENPVDFVEYAFGLARDQLRVTRPDADSIKNSEGWPVHVICLAAGPFFNSCQNRTTSPTTSRAGVSKVVAVSAPIRSSGAATSLWSSNDSRDAHSAYVEGSNPRRIKSSA